MNRKECKNRSFTDDVSPLMFSQSASNSRPKHAETPPLMSFKKKLKDTSLNNNLGMTFCLGQRPLQYLFTVFPQKVKRIAPATRQGIHRKGGLSG